MPQKSAYLHSEPGLETEFLSIENTSPVEMSEICISTIMRLAEPKCHNLMNAPRIVLICVCFDYLHLTQQQRYN